MEKPHRMSQIYGYTICLVAVITFIICMANIVNSIIDMGDPIHSGDIWAQANSPSLASFENYKMDILKNSKNDQQKTEINWTPDDKTLRSMYEAARTERIDKANHIAYRSIMTNGLLILISVILFTLHWVWMRRLSKIIVAA
jgi:hypothetical protein